MHNDPAPHIRLRQSLYERIRHLVSSLAIYGSLGECMGIGSGGATVIRRRKISMALAICERLAAAEAR